MGHSIQHYYFEVNKDKGLIQALADEDAINEGDYREPLIKKIRFIDETYESVDEAYKAIEKHDAGWYDQLAVKYHHYDSAKPTKAILNMQDRIQRNKEDLISYQEKNAIINRKSTLVGCDNCKSRINKEYVNSVAGHPLFNHCPLCRHNLSSNTIIESIANRKNRLNALELQLDDMIEKNNMKGKSKLKWLVKTEFHV